MGRNRVRDMEIIELLELHKYLETSMIAACSAFSFPSGGKKCQQVLARMTQRGLVNRFRVGSRSEYIYHIGKRSAKWKHWLELNRFHFQLLSELKAWQKVLFWQHEVYYGEGIADALYAVKTTIDGDGLLFFLEVDDGGNKFDKTEKYSAYKQSMRWKAEWWGQTFPLLLIVTPRPRELSLPARKHEWVIVTGASGGYLKLLTGRDKQCQFLNN